MKLDLPVNFRNGEVYNLEYMIMISEKSCYHPLSYKTCRIPFSLPSHHSCSFVFVMSIPNILAFSLSSSRCHPLLVSTPFFHQFCHDFCFFVEQISHLLFLFVICPLFLAPTGILVHSRIFVHPCAEFSMMLSSSSLHCQWE